jgi:hypothetical protein
MGWYLYPNDIALGLVRIEPPKVWNGCLKWPIEGDNFTPLQWLDRMSILRSEKKGLHKTWHK